MSTIYPFTTISCSSEHEAERLLRECKRFRLGQGSITLFDILYIKSRMESDMPSDLSWDDLTEAKVVNDNGRYLIVMPRPTESRD